MEDNATGLSLEELLCSKLSYDSTLLRKLFHKISLVGNDFHQKKMVLTNAMEFQLVTQASVSMWMLVALELLEHYYKLTSDPISNNMKAAYCSIAVDSTVKFLEFDTKNPIYSEAVHKIWKDMVGNLQEVKSLLVTDELNNWKTEIEASLLNHQLLEKLSSIPNTRKDAIQKLKLFLQEAWEKLAPSSQAKDMDQEPQDQLGVGVSEQQEEFQEAVVGVDKVEGEKDRWEWSEGRDSQFSVKEAYLLWSNEVEAEADWAQEVLDSSANGIIDSPTDEIPKTGEQKEASVVAKRMRFHLRSPKRLVVSPLKEYSEKKISKRRKAKKWSEHEEATLRDAVAIHGTGNWKFILKSCSFPGRTAVDLKDKWRNITKKDEKATKC